VSEAFKLARPYFQAKIYVFVLIYWHRYRYPKSVARGYIRMINEDKALCSAVMGIADAGWRWRGGVFYA